MAFIQELESSGNELFKKRSYIPLVLYIVITGIYFISPGSIYGVDEPWISFAGLFISFLGIAVRVIAVEFSGHHTSGRNVAGQVASSVNTLGIYSTVRHPLYVGNYLMWLGLVVYSEIIWFVILITLLYWLYYERIIFAEEAFLTKKFGKGYTNWADKTPCFIPKLSLWQSPESKFSSKKVIVNEIYGLTAIAVSFFYLNVLKNYILFSEFIYEQYLLIFLIVIIVLFIVIRFLKKKTKVFQG